MKLMRTPAVPTRRLKLQATVWEKNKCQCFVNCLLLTCVSWCECLKENLNFAGVLHPPGNAEIEKNTEKCPTKHHDLPQSTDLKDGRRRNEHGLDASRPETGALLKFSLWQGNLVQFFFLFFLFLHGLCLQSFGFRKWQCQMLSYDFSFALVFMSGVSFSIHSPKLTIGHRRQQVSIKRCDVEYMICFEVSILRALFPTFSMIISISWNKN